MLIGALLLLHVVWPSGQSPVAGAGRQEFRAAKGFVVAKTATSLTLLAGDLRVLVAITSETRVLSQRHAFSDIAPNDVVRAEGRWTTGNRLLAERIDVVVAAGSLALKRVLVTPTFELLGFGN
jgi:hypothetical protein